MLRLPFGRYLSNQEGHAAKIEFLFARAASSCARMGRASGAGCSAAAAAPVR